MRLVNVLQDNHESDMVPKKRKKIHTINDDFIIEVQMQLLNKIE